MTATIALINAFVSSQSHHFVSYMCMMGTLDVYFLSKLQADNMLLLTVVTMLCITSHDLLIW